MLLVKRARDSVRTNSVRTLLPPHIHTYTH